MIFSNTKIHEYEFVMGNEPFKAFEYRGSVFFMKCVKSKSDKDEYHVRACMYPSIDDLPVKQKPLPLKENKLKVTYRPKSSKGLNTIINFTINPFGSPASENAQGFIRLDVPFVDFEIEESFENAEFNAFLASFELLNWPTEI